MTTAEEEIKLIAEERAKTTQLANQLAQLIVDIKDKDMPNLKALAEQTFDIISAATKDIKRLKAMNVTNHGNKKGDGV